jgi:hypothetical protein
MQQKHTDQVKRTKLVGAAVRINEKLAPSPDNLQIEYSSPRELQRISKKSPEEMQLESCILAAKDFGMNDDMIVLIQEYLDSKDHKYLFDDADIIHFKAYKSKE